MIRSHFGIERNPFDPAGISLLEHQQLVLDTLMVHCRQGGLCILMGEPGTGKSAIKQALIDHNPKRMITPVVNRTLHTYSSTLAILSDAFGIEPKGRDTHREKLLIQAAWKLHSEGRMIVPIVDDAHLLHIDALRKLRLLLEDFPASHNLVLVAQPQLMAALRLSINEDIRSRVTYSTTVPRLNNEHMQDFLHAQLERAGLPHATFDEAATALALRSAEGILRRLRNLALSALLEAARARTRTVTTDHINAVLMQPHWRLEHDLPA